MPNDDPILSPLTDGAADWGDTRDSDPDHEAIGDEIARMSSMTESGNAPTDWKMIAEKGCRILSVKAKDIQIAGYTATALVMNDGVNGLLRGIRLLASVFGEFSDAAFPPKSRKRARVNAVNWWLERVEGWFEANELQEIEPQLHADLKNAAAELDSALVLSLEDSAPILSGVKAAIDRIPVKEPPPPEPETAEEIAVEAVNAPAPAAPAASDRREPAPAAPAGTSGMNRDDAAKAIQRLLAEAANCAEIIAADPSEALPYRVRRWAAWSQLRAVPPAEDGRTMLPPPESHIAQALNSLFDSGEYLKAIRLAEDQVGVYLFWLDPHRVTANSLAALGTAHQGALKALQGETSLFLERFPALARLSFSDGLPFADPRTRAWLASLAESGSSGAAETSPEIAEAVDKARNLAGVNPEEALDILTAALAKAGHPRDGLLVHIEIVKTFSAAGRREAVLAQAGTLLSVLDEHSLDKWDPRLAAQALSALIGGITEEDDAELASTLRRRLARTAPTQYLKL